MDEAQPTFFTSLVDEALNDYLEGATSRSLAILHISSYEKTEVFLSVLKFSCPVIPSGKLKFVYGSETTFALHYISDQEEIIAEFGTQQIEAIRVGEFIQNQFEEKLRETIFHLCSSAGIKQFDIVISHGVISSLATGQSVKPIPKEEEVCRSLLETFGQSLTTRGMLVIDDIYSPDWLNLPHTVVNSGDLQAACTGGPHTHRRSGIKPDKLIELATYKLSQCKEGYEYLRSPLFSVRPRSSSSYSTSETSAYIADEQTLDYQTREYFIALERSARPLDEAHIVETVKRENESIFARLSEHINSLKDASTDSEYRASLNRLLSVKEGTKDPLYAQLARSVYIQILLEGMNNHLDLTNERMIFWMAYESHRTGVMPARVLGDDYPLFGYSFGPPHNDQFRTDSLTRFWLNIILNNEGFQSTKFDARRTLDPPSIHDWFVQHLPFVASTFMQPAEQPLETLTVYVNDKKQNRRLALVEGHNSSRRHHRIELQPFDSSNQGEYWGFQLAEELAGIKGKSPNSPYQDLPWPYEKADRDAGLVPEVVNAQSFVDESERLRRDFARGQELRASCGWIRCSLYSLFLSMCLGDTIQKELDLPEWVVFYKKLLQAMGYTSLIEKIDLAYMNSVSYVRSATSRPLTSLSWVAPPVLVSLIEAPRRLGSILIASSTLLPVVAFKQLKNSLLTTFIALREAEDLIENEKTSKQSSLFEGHAKSVEGFSHEISKVANALYEHYLLPVDSVFEIRGQARRSEWHTWPSPAGIISASNNHGVDIASWRICPTPMLLRGLSNVLYMWSSSPSWWRTEGLAREQPFESVIQIIKRIGVSVGVAMRFGLFSDPPLSFESVKRIENFLQEQESSFLDLIVDNIRFDRKLMWKGTKETRFAESAYLRMFVVAISNAVNNIYEPRRLEIDVEATDKEVFFEVRNSRNPTEPGNPTLHYFESTRSALENCVRILNNGVTPDEKSLLFDETSDKKTWKTRTRALLRVNNREGREIEWLRMS